MNALKACVSRSSRECVELAGAGWLAGCLVGWLVGSMAGLAGWAGWLAGWLEDRGRKIEEEIR